MPLHPEAQQLIKQIEELSGRTIHVTEDPELKVMATITTARALGLEKGLHNYPVTLPSSE
jgi:hypothetical protein